MMYLACFSAVAQPVNVTGKVNSQKNGQLPEAITVTVPEKAATVLSKLDGNFSITATDVMTTLPFSFIGLADQEILLRRFTRLPVSLNRSTPTPDEVVVTSDNTVKRRDLIADLNLKDIETMDMLKKIFTVCGLYPGKKQTLL